MDHVFFFVNEPGQPDMLSCFSVAFITLLRPIILQMRSIPHDWFRTQASDYIDIHQLVHTAHRIRQSAPHSLLQRMFTSIPPFIPLPHKCIAYPVHDRVPIVVLNHRKAQMEDIQKKEEDLGRQMEMQSIVTKGIGKEKENEERWEKGKSEMRMIEKRRREAEQKRREEEQDKAERRKKSEEESKQKGLERVQKRTDLNKQKMAEAPKRIQFVDDRLKELNEQAQADEEELQERMEEDQIGELQRDALFEWIAENDSAEKKRDEDEQLRRDEEFGRLIAQRRRMYEAQKREEDAQRRPRLSNQLDEEREKEQKRRERMSEQQRQLFRNGISEQLGMADDEKANTMRLIQEDESWADRREREEERQRQAVSDQRRKRGKEDVEVEARKQQELQQQAEQDWMDSMKTLNVGRHARQRDRLRTDQTMKDLAEYEMALRKMQGALQQRLAAEEKFLERAKVDSLEYETKLDEKEGMINEGRRGVQNALNKQRDRMNDIVRTSEDVVLGGDVEWSHAWHAKQRDEAYRGMAQERRQHQRRREERDDLDQDIAERDAFQRRWEPHERRVREKGEKLDRMMEPFEFKGEQGETVFLRQNQDLHDTFTSPSRSFIVSRLD
ncbi:hypothetical protein BLNAU_13146 [Blattamonas nauphoetae]|uniref:Trichohyalin-plectin-homology domain-containing protein n=1 Tax=Blattamonas nauphoetae TaxID=2049346 RepID=A0ABQ9XP51_9EUKA|nr:hypothetical protein BLNAU_13146 [Blattamonas nauphoetae]